MRRPVTSRPEISASSTMSLGRTGTLMLLSVSHRLTFDE